MNIQTVFNNPPPESKDINLWSDKERTFQLRLPNLDERKKEIEYIFNYANKVFEEKSETKFINENKGKLWFWKNVSYVFSTGKIYEKFDVDVMNEMLKYFDNSLSAFLPNDFKIMNYENDIIKQFENTFNIGNGNYHIMLVPFIKTKDFNDVPEPGYRRFGPLNAFVELEDIASYLMETFHKFAAMPEYMTKSLKGTFGVPREIEFNVKREPDIRSGYIDQNTYEIEPIEDAKMVSKTWYNDNVDEEASVGRRRITGYYRQNAGTDYGRPEGKRPDRHSKNGLYGRIKADEKGYVLQSTGIIPDELGVHLKINDFYETLQNKEEKPSYIIYDTEGENEVDKYVDSIAARENVPLINKRITPKN